jgi:hypothetical protein
MLYKKQAKESNMKSSINMVFYAMLFVPLIWNYVYSEIPGSFHSNLTYGEQKAYCKLAQELHGKVAFIRSGRIKVITVGETVSQDMGLNGVASGHVVKFVRWSPDGNKLAVLTQYGYSAKGNVYVMDASKNAPLTLLVSDANWTPNCPIEFHPNGYEVLYAKNSVLWAININSRSVRQPFNTSDCNGEMGVSADGNRMVWRGEGNKLYKYDFTSKISERYNPSTVCSAGISPDGTLVMNNTTAHTDAFGTFEEHKTLQIWSFDTTGVLRTELILTDGLPDPHWDNHHWSNSNDWIAGKGHDNSGGWGEAYVINVPNNITYRASWEREADYPDLWVDSTSTSVKSESSSSSTSNKNQIGVQLINQNGSPQLRISMTGQHNFRVFNILGQLLRTQSGYGPSSYNFPDLRSGLYFIQIITQQGTSIQKMVIAR